MTGEPWYAQYERAAARRKARDGLSIGWSDGSDGGEWAQVYHLPAKPPEPEAIPDGPPMLPGRDFTIGDRVEPPREWYWNPVGEPPLWRAALEALGEIITAIFRRGK